MFRKNYKYIYILALEYLEKKFADMGYKVFTVPEIPTITAKGGGMIVVQKLTQDQILQFQTLLMKAVMDMENYFLSLAKLNNKPAIVLFDRGVLDPRAYMDDETFQAVLDENNWSLVQLRDKRYDSVIHLVTVAEGHEQIYSLDNNVARYEDIPTAKLVDERLQKAYIGHPHHKIIKDTDDMQSKINEVISFITKSIGKDKFLIENVEIPNDIVHQCFDVEEIFLKCGDNLVYDKIRKRGNQGTFSYLRAQRQAASDESKITENKQQISSREYLNLIKDLEDTENYSRINKKRYTFIHNKVVVVMEKFVNKDITVLRYDSQDKIDMPDFVKIKKDLQKDKEFYTHLLAKK